MTKENNTQLPHNGQWIMKAVEEEKISFAELGRRMGVDPSSFRQYGDSDSLQMRIWWKLGLAINRNLIAEIGDRFPVSYETKREKERVAERNNLQKELEKAQAEIEKLKTQLEVYQRIVEKRL
ncbi:MAG TPA: hypothetical protein DDW85_05150 [Porphyromonadaceae bacterium]|nr:hypothetical protein [Porphyromonadaceae bacterium]